MDFSCPKGLKPRNERGMVPIVAILLVLLVVGIMLGATLLSRNRSDTNQQADQASSSAKKRLAIGDFAINNGQLPRIDTVQPGSNRATLSSALAPVGTNIRNLPIEVNGTRKQFPFICPNTVCKPVDLEVPVSSIAVTYDRLSDSLVLAVKVNGTQIYAQLPCSSTSADPAICVQGRNIPVPAMTPPTMPVDNQTKGSSPNTTTFKLSNFYSLTGVGNTNDPFTFIGCTVGRCTFRVDDHEIDFDHGEWTTVNGTFVRVHPPRPDNPNGVAEYFDTNDNQWHQLAQSGTEIRGGIGGGTPAGVNNPTGIGSGGFYGPDGVGDTHSQFIFTGCDNDGCHFSVDGHDITVQPGDITTINDTFIRYAPNLTGIGIGRQLQFWDGTAWRDIALNNTPIPGGIGAPNGGGTGGAGAQPPSSLQVGSYYCDAGGNCGTYLGNNAAGQNIIRNGAGQFIGTIITNPVPQTPPTGNGNNGAPGPGQYNGPTGVACGAGGCVASCGIACTGTMVTAQPGLGNYTQNANGTFSPCNSGAAGCTWSLQQSNTGANGGFTNGLHSPSGCQTVQCMVDHGEVTIEHGG